MRGTVRGQKSIEAEPMGPSPENCSYSTRTSFRTAAVHPCLSRKANRAAEIAIAGSDHNQDALVGIPVTRMIATGTNTAIVANTNSAISGPFTCVVSPRRSLVASGSGLGTPTCTRSLAAATAPAAGDEYGATLWRRSGLEGPSAWPTA